VIGRLFQRGADCCSISNEHRLAPARRFGAFKSGPMQNPISPPSSRKLRRGSRNVKAAPAPYAISSGG